MPKTGLTLKIEYLTGETALRGYLDYKVTPLTFLCSVEGTALEADRYDFVIYVPEYQAHTKEKPPRGLHIDATTRPGEHTPFISVDTPEEYKDKEGYEGPWFRYADDFKPILEAIQVFLILTDKELATLNGFWFPNKKRRPNGVEFLPDTDNPFKPVQSGGCEYLGGLLKRILEATGYVVTIEIPHYYYPAPAQMGFIVPAFGIGLQKKVTPEKIMRGYEDSYVYFSYKKPRSEIEVQLNILDQIPEERLKNIERSLKESLSPYGLKCIYLILEGCAKNRQQNYMVLDSNRALDVLGHKRDRRGTHYTKNRKNLTQTLDELTRLNINFETRIPIKEKRGKEEVTRFVSPLISTTGKFEKWEVDEGDPIEKGKLIRDGILIFFHPEIYKFIEDRYTDVPYRFLAIDVGRRPHAVQLYSYIMNQWRIGWHQYRGTIKQPMRQILEGSGLFKPYHAKRKDKRGDFIEGIKGELHWLQKQGWGWIRPLKFDTKNKPLLDQIVTIEMADNHPFKTSMARQIKEKQV